MSKKRTLEEAEHDEDLEVQEEEVELDPEHEEDQEEHEEDEEEDEEEEEEEDDDEEEEEEGEDEEGKKKSEKPAKAKRGRKPLPVFPSVISDEGKSYEVIDDEYNLTEDEDGEKKIDKNGKLQGGRQFRVRSFTVKGKGDKLFMLSTEPARCVGFRDSYLLFQKHKLLHKYVITQDEKFDLIDRDIIPHSYKGRVIGLVTARSIFREFGAKIIVGGKYIIDDYYPERVRKLGLVKEGELAEPDDVNNKSFNQNQYVAWHGASNVYHQSTAAPPVYQAPYESLELKSMKVLRSTTHINEENWMFKHSEATTIFNQTLNVKRQTNLQRGFKDIYTGLTFIPASTQSSRVKYIKIVDPNDENTTPKHKLIYETKIKANNIAKITGLAAVPKELFEDVVDEETRNAILEQQRLERTQF